jgi:long-chain fatty acid transport protein
MNECASHARKVRLFAAAMLLISSRLAHGQTNAEVNAGIQFNFSSPGARSLGLGGAFLGLADDATAAYTNPAGLTVLSKPEVSAEGRRSSYTNEYTDHGHAFGNPTGIGTDTVAGLAAKSAKDDVNSLSFVSFVYPQSRWSVAAYRQELANFGASFKTQGAFLGSAPAVGRLFPTESSLSLRIINLGISGAYRITDELSLGVGISDYHFALSSLTTRFAFPPSGFGPADFSANVVNFQTQDGGESDVAVNGGLLWKINPQWSAGAVFRQGPSFNFSTSNVVVDPRAPGGQAVVASNQAVFHVPDVYGAGVAYRPAEALTLTADYDRIRYSQLARHSVDVFTDPVLVGPGGGQPVQQLVVSDANEVHLGVEYVLTRLKYPVALRVGGWLDPAHKIHFEGATGTPSQQVLSVLFRPGKDEAHVSGGFGVVLGERFQLDAAYDYSKFVSIASLSGVVRF